jgi:prepilin-type N-terminal cleavage/methylation domain-containing protein
LPRTSAADDGYTLVELVIVMGIMAILSFAILGVFVSTQRADTFARERSESLDEMRITLTRMTKDIRQASDVRSATPASRIEMDTYVNGVERVVVYEATGATVTRSEDGSTPVVIQNDVASSSLFTYEPSLADAAIVKIVLSVEPERLPDTTLVLESRVRLRNVARSGA